MRLRSNQRRVLRGAPFNRAARPTKRHNATTPTPRRREELRRRITARRGVMIVAGGGSNFANAAVTLRVLRRHLNCSLPVEIVHFGPGERHEKLLAMIQRDFTVASDGGGAPGAAAGGEAGAPPIYITDALDERFAEFALAEHQRPVEPGSFAAKAYALAWVTRFQEVGRGHLLLPIAALRARRPQRLAQPPPPACCAQQLLWPKSMALVWAFALRPCWVGFGAGLTPNPHTPRTLQVLMLDADNMPLRCPDFLFESQEFREHGNLFWPGGWCLAAAVWLQCWRLACLDTEPQAILCTKLHTAL